MQKGDVVLVDYTGRDLTTSRVFDTTVGEVAKKEKTFDERITYKPVPIVLGKNEMLKALEDEMETMKVGDTKKIVLSPAKAFGERDARNIRLTALKDFREHKMTPYPGMIVEVNGVQGKVQTVSSGRVAIDFNHPLAGKELEYEITIRKQFDTLQEQVSALFDKFFPFVSEQEKKIAEKNGVVTIDLPEKAKEIRETELLKQIFTKVLKEQLTGVKEVEYVGDEPPTEIGGLETESSETASKPEKDLSNTVGKKAGLP